MPGLGRRTHRTELNQNAPVEDHVAVLAVAPRAALKVAKAVEQVVVHAAAQSAVLLSSSALPQPIDQPYTCRHEQSLAAGASKSRRGPHP